MKYWMHNNADPTNRENLPIYKGMGKLIPSSLICHDLIAKVKPCQVIRLNTMKPTERARISSQAADRDER